jgi:hypothetical protein
VRDDAHNFQIERIEPMQLPRFRAISRCYACSNWWPAGSEFDCFEWPTEGMGEMEPVNDEAKRVLAYQREHRLARGFPTRLMRDNSAGKAEIFLPPYPGNHKNWLCPAPAETTAKPNSPRYQTQAHVLLGNTHHKRGDLIQFLHWPSGLRLLPLNEVAKRIVAYEAACGDHRDFPFAPWNVYTAEPYLPNLYGVDLNEVLKPFRAPPPRPHRMKVSRARGTAPRVSA